MKLKYLWWMAMPTVNIRIFYRCGLLGPPYLPAAVAFKNCSQSEREFIVWRDPVFEHFIKELDLP